MQNKCMLENGTKSAEKVSLPTSITGGRGEQGILVSKQSTVVKLF